MVMNIANRSIAVKHEEHSDSRLQANPPARYGIAVPTQTKSASPVAARRAEWKETGRRVKLAMAKRGLTQAQLAEAIGMHQPDVSKALRGARGFDLRQMQAIAKVLRVDVGGLMSGAQVLAVEMESQGPGFTATSDPDRRVRPPQLEAYFDRNREDLTDRERRYLEGLRSMEEAGAPAPDDKFYDAMLEAFRELRRRRAQREGGGASE